jgi:hypothetical protein
MMFKKLQGILGIKKSDIPPFIVHHIGRKKWQANIELPCG